MKRFNGKKNQLLLFLFALLQGYFVTAQDSSKTDVPLYYRVTLGGGIGSGYPLQVDGAGIGGLLEFALQRKTSIYSLGIRGVEEFNLLDASTPSNSVSSAEITYGKTFQARSFFASISAGVGYVTSLQKGELLQSTGSWFGNSTYEKITHHGIGFPVAAKILWVPCRVYGVGTELYVNINSQHTFYGINICHQLGKLRPRKIRATK